MKAFVGKLAERFTFQELQEQALGVLVYGMCPDALELSAAQELELKRASGVYMRQHMRLLQDLQKVFSHLKANGLQPVLLKGQGCAWYYPFPYLRATGDLDIWIGERDYGHAKEVTLALCGEQHISETAKHMHAVYGGTTVEIHRVAEALIHPAHHSYYKELSEQQMAQARAIELGGVQFQIPPVQFQALQVFMHLWHHFSTQGIGLRQFVDLAFVLHRDVSDIDLEQLQRDLQALGRLEAWQMVGCVLVDELSFPKEKFPFYDARMRDKARLMLDLVLAEGNFGHKRPLAGGNVPKWTRKFRNLRLWCMRLPALFQISPSLCMEQFWQMARHTRDAFLKK